MSAPIVYRSTDASAPTLSGTAGDLVNLLDKCLVAGYGSQSAAGWTKPYTATNRAVFRQGGGNQFYLWVNDDATTHPVTAKDATLRGWEVLGSIPSEIVDGTHTGPFPDLTQRSSTAPIAMRKSATADATTRSWIVVADDRTVYVFIATGDVAGGRYCAFMFGDFYSLLSGDGYRTALIGRTTDASTYAAADDMLAVSSAAGSFAGLASHYFARGYTGTGGSINCAKQTDTGLLSTGAPVTLGAGVMAYPNPTDGGIVISRVFIQEPTTGGVNSRRGWMRGFWAFGHAIANVVDGDTFTGTGDLAGRTFLVIKSSNGANLGLYVIETSNTWDTSS